MIKTMLGNVEDNFNGHYVIEDSRLCLNDEELEKIDLPPEAHVDENDARNRMIERMKNHGQEAK